MPAHMTRSYLRRQFRRHGLFECPIQLEARIEGSRGTVAYGRTVPLEKSLTFALNVLRVHLDPSVVLNDVHPNMWTPLMKCHREGYRTSPAS